jgi:UDP-GlcNAc:polypeptide alpha-N-acetylglucosaminyltransferase
MAYSAPLTTGSASKDLVRGVDHTGEETIFVNIASFRDEECPPTLRDMFLKARAPWRVFVGVLQQNDEKDPRCWPAEWANCSKHTFCPSDQVRIRHIAPNEAKGPTYGRYLADAMYRGEKYYFLMDSHNRFVTHWDDIIIRVYRKAPSAKAVLSHYPEALLLEEKDSKPLDGRDTTTFMCGAKFIADGYLRFDGAVVHKTEIPRLQPFSAAGMLFADAQMMKEVPFDPHLPFLFDGEEFLYTVRMWTHGWDIYAPSENIMYHFYYRAKSAKVWSEPNNNWYHWQRRSVERVQYMLGSTHANTTNRIVPLNTTNDYILVELDRYGLGTERSIEDYYKFSGVDPVHRTVPNWCTRA